MVNVLQELKNMMAFSSKDWAEEKEGAFLYAVILGWDPGEDEPEEESAMPEIAAKFNLSDDQVAKLRTLHKEFQTVLSHLESRKHVPHGIRNNAVELPNGQVVYSPQKVV